MRKFWYLMMAGTLAGWAFALIGAVKPFKNNMVQKTSENLFGIWLFGHMAEMVPGFLIGRYKGLGIIRIAIKTMLYGFTWWMPLLFGTFKK